ncbi:MAG: ATP-binding cassette domain-containing protein [Bacteroidia bacterium]
MKTATNFKVSEIEEYINSGNHTLGFRRFLDLCLEKDLNINQKVTILKLCDDYNENLETGDLSENFLNAVSEMANQIADIQDKLEPESKIDEVVNARKISKAYSSGHFKLSPIGMSINTGELVGIVGENGNGKTTLLRMMASDLSLNEGEINYELGIGDIDLYEQKRSIAYIPQRIQRWYGKLKNNLHFAASSRGIYGFENEYLVKVMLTRLGLNKYKDLFWTQISSGYRTRFELARILLLQPKLLILDEPLANLDINAQQTFLQDIRNLAKSRKNPLAILFSSQQLHEVEKVADHIVFLRNGESIYNSTLDTNEKLETHTETELETAATRDELLVALSHVEGLTVKQQGGVYIIRCSNSISSSEILKKVLAAGMSISYYRDLTHSTKKFFNQN